MIEWIMHVVHDIMKAPGLSWFQNEGTRGELPSVYGPAAPERVNSMIQFVSQVFPPSAENACSHRQDKQEVAVIADHTNRT